MAAEVSQQSSSPQVHEPSSAHSDLEEVVRVIPENARTTKLNGQFWIWAGANIAPINWVLGALGIAMGLGLWDTMLVLVLGNLIGMAVFGFFVVLGQRSGLSGMVLARGVFGRKGAYLPAVIQMVVVIGWCAVNTWIILDLVMALFAQLGWANPDEDNIGVRIAVAAAIMAIQVAISFLGYKAIAKFERWTVPPTIVVLVAMSIAAWFFMDIDWGYAGSAASPLTEQERIIAMSQVMTAIGIGWGLTWLTYAGDYSRFVSKTVPERKTYIVSALGQFIPVVWLGLLGATLATKSSEIDPGAMIVENFGALALPVLLLVLHGPIATNILNIYSFSVTAQALDLKLSRRVMSILVGIFAMIAVIVFINIGSLASTLDAWLIGVVGWTTTWGAVVFVHYYLLHPRIKNFADLTLPVAQSKIPMVNWKAMAAFALGIFATWLCMYGMLPALQGPIATALGGMDLSWLAGLLTSGISYWLLGRQDVISARKLNVPAANESLVAE
ncbi:purine-cytosine permease family protein [Neomicrococcus aestuarii]|uniref:Cytosine permease n=1 Tax=Neomicrococcus aestuarii TaxID=556325 RepID=A0A1L2ZP08_9MICC|nr:cytosine permease [Neomicrococcus aestuarii]APF40802.1 cytosine permease [Neomicrococcus aestuarii]